VHRVREPNPARRFGNAEVTRSWFLRFPGPREDCEAFFVHAGYGYLIAKPRTDGQVTLYRYALSNGSRSILLEEVAKLSVPGSVTDAGLSEDGERLAIVTSLGVEIRFIAGNPEAVASAPQKFTLFPNDFMEGGTFVDGGFLTSAETRELWLFTKVVFQCDVPLELRPDLQISEVRSNDSRALRIEFDAVATYRYSLEACDNPAGSGWLFTGDSLDATNQTRAFFERPQNESAQFYRLGISPTTKSCR
jgi:hypothetical protein